MADKRFWRNASGRFTFGLTQLPGEQYAALCKELSQVFSLSPSKPLVAGLDVVFQDFRRGDVVVGLEWDNRTGFTVVAQDPDSEDLVREMAAYVLASAWVASPGPSLTPGRGESTNATS